jgi:K+ transporter
VVAYPSDPWNGLGLKPRRRKARRGFVWPEKARPAHDAPQRVAGVAVYLTARRDVVPAALAWNLKHNRVLHEHVVALRVSTDRSPRVAEARRLAVEKLASGFSHITLNFGFAEKPDVLAALKAHADAVGFDANEASFSWVAKFRSHRCAPMCRFGKSVSTLS